MVFHMDCLFLLDSISFSLDYTIPCSQIHSTDQFRCEHKFISVCDPIMTQRFKQHNKFKLTKFSLREYKNDAYVL